jgi:hypothetical protein
VINPVNYNVGFRFTNVYIQLANDFKIRNFGNLIPYATS